MTAWTRSCTKRVVLVDDDELHLEILSGALEDHGFSVRGFRDGHAMLQMLGLARQADVLVFDWAMPTLPGIELLSQVRQLGLDVPVAFLTAQSLVTHERAALSRGAVDFIDKTRGIEVLTRRLSRIMQNQWNVSAPIEAPTFRGHLTLRSRTARAEWRGKDLGLTIAEYKILALLSERPGTQVTYRDIYDAMHYAGFAAGHGETGYHINVRQAIKRIRAKFKAIDGTFDEIVNHLCVGYSWRA